MSLIWRCAAAFFVVAFCVLAQTNPYQNVFESYAAKIQLFATGDFVYDRSLKGRYCGDLCQPAIEFHDYLKANRLEPVRLQALLKHGDPKVRTLAMAALFDQGDKLPRPLGFSRLRREVAK